MAALVLALNDALLKSSYPGLVTGKLSDFAGLFLVSAVLGPRATIGGVLAVAFVLWKSPLAEPVLAWWNAIVPFPLSRTPDLTDLVAMLAIPFGLRYAKSTPKPGVVLLPRGIAVLLASVAVLATSKIENHVKVVMPPGVTDTLRVTLYELQTKRVPPRIQGVSVVTCAGGLKWEFHASSADSARLGAAPLARWQYGNVPTGFVESLPARRLATGRYAVRTEAEGLKSAELAFEVRADGRYQQLPHCRSIQAR